MDVLLPQLGETVSEGKITVWFKNVGDAVVAGENLFEIETDKVSMEVPAIAAGTLSEIRVPAGQVAKVGAVIAVLGGAVAAPVPVAAVPSTHAARLAPFEEVRTPARNFGPARLAGGVVVSPLARRVAAELGVDLAALAARAGGRRIGVKDVQAAGAAAPAFAPAAGPGADALRAGLGDAPVTDIPVDGMRATIARRLVESVQTIPQFQLSMPVAMARLIALRAEANEDLADGQARLSLNDFIVRAWALALMKVPEANAIWAGDRILRLGRADVGVAVALPGGLMTPVLRGADGKSVSVISAELRDLVGRARAKKLRPDELAGGASAVSNLGMHGVEGFSAIINPPHATILAVGSATRRPVEREDGSVRFAAFITATLSCDHRVVDGALGAALLAAFRALVEHPTRILI